MENFFLYRKAWRSNEAPHEEPKLDAAQWKSLLRKGGLLVRNVYDFDQKEESSFWYVLKDGFGGLDELSSNNRNKVKRAINSFDFRQIDIELVRKKGFPILQATFEDYAAAEQKMTDSFFASQLARGERDGFEYWGVFDKEDGALVGWCDVHVWSDACEYGIIGMLPKYKHNNTYPYYGLFFKLNEHYLGERHFRYVSDGTRSITEHSNIQNFLMENFKFRKAYCKLELHYQWWMGLAVKLLYPFRKIIPLQHVKAVLRQEAFAREQKR